MTPVDYYQILGIEPYATRAEVRRAFRLLAMHYHPDQNRGDPDAEERFKLITQAYKVLSDPRKRAAYDRERAAAKVERKKRAAKVVRPHPEPRPVPSEPPPRPPDRSPKQRTPWWEEEGFSTPRPETPRPKPSAKKPPAQEKPKFESRDLHADMIVPSDLAEQGGRQSLAVSYVVPCPVCQGTGARPGTPVRRCPECAANPVPGCSLCKGRGLIIQSQCPNCRGRGEAKQTKTVTVTVPALSKNGQTIRIPGEGLPGDKDEKPGDLYVHLIVKPGGQYRETDESSFSEVYVTPAMAALGGKVRVKTAAGWTNVEIPAGTRSGTVLHLEGMGPLRKGNERGDHFVTIKVVTSR